MAVWSAEQAVSEKLARDLIAEQFPLLAPVRLELLGVGWDNSAFLINGEYVFRFPRRQIAVELLRTETRVLPTIVKRLPLPIPFPEFIGTPDERFGWPFAGYRQLAGRTACAAQMTVAQRAAAAEPIAEFLAALHSVDADKARQTGAPPDLLGRLDPEKRVPQAHEYLQRAAALGLIESAEPYVRVIAETAAARPPRADALVHGDFYVRHLLVDAGGRPCGVIDWGDVHAGDSALDLAIAHSFLPPEARGAFRRAYGPIDDATWRLSRFRALAVSAILVVYGHEIGDNHLVREGLVGLQNLLS
jgi:aminoglycoside phosphotransferase (APT) family kinase protein